MALAVEEDEPSNPGRVSLFGTAAVVPHPDGIAYGIEQPLGTTGRGPRSSIRVVHKGLISESHTTLPAGNRAGSRTPLPSALRFLTARAPSSLHFLESPKDKRARPLP
jgi:hypothetical protein